MKSINNIIKNNRELLENETVRELISYIEELEDEVVESRHIKNRIKESHLIDFIIEIKDSCSNTLKKDEENERFNLNEAFDYKECIIVLEKNINQFIKDNNIKI